MPREIQTLREVIHHKPVAWICHAGWMAISADIIRGKRMTSFASIRDDMVNAVRDWVDAVSFSEGVRWCSSDRVQNGRRTARVPDG